MKLVNYYDYPVCLSVCVCQAPGLRFWTYWPIYMTLGRNIMPLDSFAFTMLSNFL